MAPDAEKDLSKLSDVADVQLQSKEHRDLLDIIDKLRSQGISQYVDLPQIVVCGDQSAGKSSVLEAISGLSFPTKDNLCTRFATELILRRHSVSAIHISIVPGADRSENEKQALRGFTSSISTDSPSLDQVVEKAKGVMGLSSAPGRVFSPSFMSYMRSSRSIILAVVSAKSDFALQSVTKHARRLDPEGMRTLGLITKPDTLDAGSDSERAYVDLAQNKDVNFRLGWHALRNRDFSSKAVTTAERDKMESEFFSKGVWASLNPAHAGIVALRPRLSHILRDQIILQLPSVLADVETGISDCKSRLKKLGASRGTLPEQRQCLLHVSNSFHIHIKAAIEGMYNGPFFGSPNTEPGYRKRLRAVVQNELLSFADEMRNKGHAVEIVEDEDRDGNHRESIPSGTIRRSKYAEKVKDLMTRTRGCELPGTYNPLIVGDLFREQCAPWEGLVHRFTSKIIEAAHFTVKSALDYAADEETAAGILHEVINPKLYDLREALNVKIAEILEPHKSGHPITYNHYLTENVQKAQAQRRKRQLERVMKEYFGDMPPTTMEYTMNPNILLSRLVESTEADMDRFASYAAIDMMEAYYKACSVALKKVVDDISVLAVEECLIQQLPALFIPETVFGFEDAVVRKIAAESEESMAERERSTARLYILETGLRDLSRLNNYPGKLAEEPLDCEEFPNNINGKQDLEDPAQPVSDLEPLEMPEMRSEDTELSTSLQDNESFQVDFSAYGRTRKSKKKSKKAAAFSWE